MVCQVQALVSMQVSRRTTYVAIATAYAVIGIAIYASVIPIPFLADDFSFLDLIRAADSAGVIFSPLAERYFRPAVVLVYYLNYQLSGLSAWTYHLSVVLLNVANAWLVFVVGRRLAPERGLGVPALAGLLFLVFGGHAEAVAWIAAMADPLVTLFVLSGLVLFDRSLDEDRPNLYLAGCWAAFAAALFSKESALVLPGLMLMWLALRAGRRPTRAELRRSIVALAGIAALLAAYFALRSSVLGFAFVKLDGLGTSPNLRGTTRAFVLRSFFPHGPVFLSVWYRHLEVVLLCPLAAILMFRLRRGDFRPLLLVGFCYLVALLPVLPLSIGVTTPESERLIYLATAFSSLLLVLFVDRTIRNRWAVASIVLLFCLGHVVALTRINKNWREATAITQNTLSTFGEALRRHGQIGRAVYVLNLPDNVGGAYIFRRGFPEALRVAVPDQHATIAQTYVLSVHAITNSADPVRVTSEGPRTFRVDVGAGGIMLGAPHAPTPTYIMREWSPRGFAIDFTEAADGSLVLYCTPRSAAVIGRLPLGEPKVDH